MEKTRIKMKAKRKDKGKDKSGKVEDKVAKVSYDLVPTVVFSHPVSWILYDGLL